jgi:hypothetical protein
MEPRLMLEPMKSKNIELEQPIAHDLDTKHCILNCHSRFAGSVLERMKTKTSNWSNQWLMILMLNTDF